MGFGKQLDAVLKAHGSNPSDISRRTGINPNTIYSLIKRDSANYSIDDFLKICKELSVDPESFSESVKESDSIELILTDHEKDIILAYRANSDMQKAVDRLLNVENEGTIKVYRAARSDNNQEDEITEMSVERLQKLKDAPKSDKNL